MGQSMAFYRGPGGSDYFGGGYRGIPSQAFDSWWENQQANGQYVAVGSTIRLDFTASWAAA
jgi:hypothetical protein